MKLHTASCVVPVCGTRVLLPDHFHLIIDPHNENLSKIMKIIKLKYSYLYKKKYKLYEKTIWQKREVVAENRTMC